MYSVLFSIVFRSTATAATLAWEGRIAVFAVGRGGPPHVLSVAEPLARAWRSEERGCGASREGELSLISNSPTLSCYRCLNTAG